MSQESPALQVEQRGRWSESLVSTNSSAGRIELGFELGNPVVFCCSDFGRADVERKHLQHLGVTVQPGVMAEVEKLWVTVWTLTWVQQQLLME